MIKYEKIQPDYLGSIHWLNESNITIFALVCPVCLSINDIAITDDGCLNYIFDVVDTITFKCKHCLQFVDLCYDDELEPHGSGCSYIDYTIDSLMQ